MKKHLPWLAHALGILLLAALVLGASSRAPRLRRSIDNSVQNLLYRLRGAQPGDPRIVLAAIDDESLSRIGAFPWRRSVWARLIDRLTRLGARTIAFDVMFLEPSAYPADDKALAEATRRSGRVIHAAILNRSRDGRPEERLDSLPIVARGAAGVGNVSVTAEIQPDGTIRSYSTRMRSSGHPDTFPMGLVAVAHYLHQDPQQLAAALPARLRLNYRGSWADRSFTVIPVCHILDDQLTLAETGALREAVVFVGSVSSLAFDLYPSPFGGQMPGPLAQLTLADNLLAHRWFATLRPAADFLVCAAPAALLMAWCAALSSAAYLAGVAGVALACVLAGWLAFAAGLWLRPTIMLTVFLVGLVWTLAARLIPVRRG
ncbi:MAG: CHASE2 domain-containing protein [Elusimicrobia bacterium]|nr:CHASE2 domain-containing protein [Elusimicrobiota bacterium]